MEVEEDLTPTLSRCSSPETGTLGYLRFGKKLPGMNAPSFRCKRTLPFSGLSHEDFIDQAFHECMNGIRQAHFEGNVWKTHPGLTERCLACLLRKFSSQYAGSLKASTLFPTASFFWDNLLGPTQTLSSGHVMQCPQIQFHRLIPLNITVLGRQRHVCIKKCLWECVGKVW